MNCDRVRLRLDSGGGDRREAAEVQEHLESCVECTAFAERQEQWRLRVQRAVRNTEAPADLGHRVHYAIARESRLQPRWIAVPLAIAAAILVAVSASYLIPARTAARPVVVARTADQITPLLQVGFRQHVHCGVAREYPDISPTLTELAHAPGANAGLINAVESHVPSGLHVVMAHQCSLNGRVYTHVIARGEGHLMSLLITKRADGEAFERDLKAMANESDTPLFGETVRAQDERDEWQTYSIDSLETGEFLIYLVSDLAPAVNLSVFKAMAPHVRASLL